LGFGDVESAAYGEKQNSSDFCSNRSDGLGEKLIREKFNSSEFLKDYVN
jgi:hypothetical protein